jgi:hypothetical protein
MSGYDDDFEDEEEDFKSTRRSTKQTTLQKSRKRADSMDARLWSANHERLNATSNKLVETARELKTAKQEIKTLKAMQRLQTKALDETTGEDAVGVRKLKSQAEEIRVLEGRMRTVKTKLVEANAQIKEKNKKLTKAGDHTSALQKLVDSKDLKERAALARELEEVKATLKERDDKIERLSKLVALQSKERARPKPKGANTAEILSLREEIGQLKAQLRQQRQGAKHLVPKPPPSSSRRRGAQEPHVASTPPPAASPTFLTPSPTPTIKTNWQEVDSEEAAGVAEAAAAEEATKELATLQARAMQEAAVLAAAAEANRVAAETARVAAEAEHSRFAAEATAQKQADEAVAKKAAEVAVLNAAAAQAIDETRKKKEALLAKLKAIDANNAPPAPAPAPAPAPPTPKEAATPIPEAATPIPKAATPTLPTTDDFADFNDDFEDSDDDGINESLADDDGAKEEPAQEESTQLPWMTTKPPKLETERKARHTLENLHKGMSSDGVHRHASGRNVVGAEPSSDPKSGRRQGRDRGAAAAPTVEVAGAASFLPSIAPGSARRQGKEPTASISGAHHATRKGSVSDGPMPWETQTLSSHRTYGDGLISAPSSAVSSAGSRKIDTSTLPTIETPGAGGSDRRGVGATTNSQPSSLSIATSAKDVLPSIPKPGARKMGGPSKNRSLGVGGPGGGSLGGFSGPRRRGMAKPKKTLPSSFASSGLDDDGMEAIAI